MTQLTPTQPSTRVARIGPLQAFAATVLAFAATSAFAAEPESTDCEPQFLNMRTEFPASARYRGAHGVVRVLLTIDADGRAKEAQVIQSSGHRRLDRAAINSVRKNWRFDVAQCSAAELATKRSVEVQFVRPIGKTPTDPVIRKVVETTQQLVARNRCDVVREDDDTIYSCVRNSGDNLAGKAAMLATDKRS